MKGYVPTPTPIVDRMVSRLFAGVSPSSADQVLDAGCGDGAFIDGVLRWCRARNLRPPRIRGVELNPSLAAKARRRFASEPSVTIENADYLQSKRRGPYRFVIGNPPYVSITALTEQQRQRYAESYVSAKGRFDAYMLFMERAASELTESGRLVFITPEKFLYVESALRLREFLATTAHINAIELVDEESFPDRTTYPAITTLTRGDKGETRVTFRDGKSRTLSLPANGELWWPRMQGFTPSESSAPTLADACIRVSAGVATGADQVFVLPADGVSSRLRHFAHPAIAGKDLSPNSATLPQPKRLLLTPYDLSGTLLEISKMSALVDHLGSARNKSILRARTCAARKPWYAFHDSFPIQDMLRPKILFKDIGERPRFWADTNGSVVPLHSVYYAVPHDPKIVVALCEWLNGAEAQHWLTAHCQRAASGFIRLQSRVIQQLPIPERFAGTALRQAA